MEGEVISPSGLQFLRFKWNLTLSLSLSFSPNETKACLSEQPWEFDQSCLRTLLSNLHTSQIRLYPDRNVPKTQNCTMRRYEILQQSVADEQSVKPTSRVRPTNVTMKFSYSSKYVPIRISKLLTRAIIQSRRSGDTQSQRKKNAHFSVDLSSRSSNLRGNVVIRNDFPSPVSAIIDNATADARVTVARKAGRQADARPVNVIIIHDVNKESFSARDHFSVQVTGGTPPRRLSPRDAHRSIGARRFQRSISHRSATADVIDRLADCRGATCLRETTCLISFSYL